MIRLPKALYVTLIHKNDDTYDFYADGEITCLVHVERPVVERADVTARRPTHCHWEEGLAQAQDDSPDEGASSEARILTPPHPYQCRCAIHGVERLPLIQQLPLGA